MNDRNAELDAQYARGEITREEWMRRRTSDTRSVPPSVPPTPSRPPRSSATRGRSLLAVVVIIVGIAVVAAFLWSLVGNSGLGTNPAYLQPRQLQASDLSALNASATQGLAFKDNTTLWFRSGAVTLVVYASPPEHDMAFVVQGMVNPTIHVAPGSRVTIVAVNLDSDEYHTWSLSTRGPPYSSTPMMGSGGMISGMMMGTTMLAPASNSGMWSQQMSFTAVPGTYWYVCAVSGHATQGMYGGLVAG